MGRAPCCDKVNVKKGPWSPEEDAKLKDYIENFGAVGNWISLPQKAGLKRCGKSCRLRWLNYLRPNIKHGEFSEEEDRIICSLYASIGSRWSIIAAQLPGRTDNDIKNYWNTKLKKKLMGTINSYININNNNNNNNNQKKIQNNLNYYSMHHNDHFPSSLSSASSLISHALSPSLSSSFQCTSTYPIAMSFTDQGCSNKNNTLILMQNHQHHQKQQVKDKTLLVFGGDHHIQQPSRCSSDGSSSVTQITNRVKVEDNQQNYGGFYTNQAVNHHHQGEDHQGKMLLVDQKPNRVTSAVLWGQNSESTPNATSMLDNYGLEEIKRLISTNYSSDESKVDEKDMTKLMYYNY